MLTNFKEYLSLPLEHHPTTCQECGGDLGEMFIVWKLMSANEIVLCCDCAERIGFALWIDSLRKVH